MSSNHGVVIERLNPRRRKRGLVIGRIAPHGVRRLPDDGTSLLSCDMHVVRRGTASTNSRRTIVWIVSDSRSEVGLVLGDVLLGF